MSVVNPAQPVRPAYQRPKSKSGFSFRSDRSSVTPKKKDTLIETTAEKRKNHMSEKSKANPNAAINEAQPVALALEKPTIQPLRGMSHRDSHGRTITDPDLSNPTRARWERPLDTIRSFETAIDNEWRRRQSLYRPETAPDGQGWQSQRNSSNWGGNNGFDHIAPGPRSSNHSGHNGQISRRDSYGEGGYPPMPHRFGPRQQSDPALNRYANNGNGPYPNTGYQRSRDTLNTGASSGSASDAWREGTEPSSDNSSLERGNVTTKPGGEYNYSSYPEYPVQNLHPTESSNFQRNMYPQRPNALLSSPHLGNNHQSQGPPAPPPKPNQHQIPRKNIIRLDADVTNGAGKAGQNLQRKSWLKRTFSRKT